MKALLLRVGALLVIVFVASLALVRGAAVAPLDAELSLIYRANIDTPPFMAAFQIDTQGAHIRQIRWQGKEVVNHACALDGEHLAFVTEDDALYVASVHGDVQALDAGLRLSQADLDISNGGQQIAYSLQEQQCCGTFIYDTQTGVTQRLDDGFFHSFSPSLAPDHSQIALAADSTRYRPYVYTMPIGGNAPALLAEGTGPLWSPVGSYLALNGIALVDVRTHLRVNISSNNDIYPAWSPNGAWIAYEAYANRRYDLAIMRWDGSDQRLLTHSQEMEHDMCWLRGDAWAFID
jgi:Tol biopolymer transport system component